MTGKSIIEPIKRDPDITERDAVILEAIMPQSEQCLMIGLVLDSFYNRAGGRNWPTWGIC